jgi:hypothetical protein
MRMVLLRHELPDGTGHFDWMVESSPAGGLITFRVGVRIDLPESTQFDAEPIGEHRREYLDYEGPVSGDRGTVVRVAIGTVEYAREEPSRIEIRGGFNAASNLFVGRKSGLRWKFSKLAVNPTGQADARADG